MPFGRNAMPPTRNAMPLLLERYATDGRHRASCSEPLVLFSIRHLLTISKRLNSSQAISSAFRNFRMGLMYTILALSPVGPSKT